MTMSLKCMIGKWLHKGQISQEEYDAVIKKLEGHDNQIRAEVFDNVYTELEKYKREINLANTPWNFIELVFSKMKAEVQK